MTTVLDDYTARSSQELSVSKGQHVRVVQRQLPNAPDWCLIRLLNDQHHHQSNSSSLAASSTTITTASTDLSSPPPVTSKYIEGLVPAAILKSTKSSASNSHPPPPPLILPIHLQKHEQGKQTQPQRWFILAVIRSFLRNSISFSSNQIEEFLLASLSERTVPNGI